MSDLDFAIDVVELPTTRPLLCVGLLSALAAAGLLTLDVDERQAPRPPVAPGGLSAPATAVAAVRPSSFDIAPDIAPSSSHTAPSSPDTAPSSPDSAPSELEPDTAPVAVAALPKAQRRVERRQLRAIVEGKGDGILSVLGKLGATRPAVADKIASNVAAPRAEQLVAKLDEHDVDRTMRERGSAFRACYERSLKMDSSLRGALDVSFTIAPNGVVRGARVRPREKGPQAIALARCVKGVVQRAAFGPTGGAPLSVRRALVFRQGGGSATSDS